MIAETFGHLLISWIVFDKFAILVALLKCHTNYLFSPGLCSQHY